MSTDTKNIRDAALEFAKKTIEQGFPGMHGSVTFNLCNGHVADAEITEQVKFKKEKAG